MNRKQTDMAHLPDWLQLVFHEREPYPRRVSLDDVYANLALPGGDERRPFVYLNMVQMLDGQAVLEGTAFKIGTDVDHYLLRQLRVHADAVLYGAGTLRKDDVIVTTHAPLQERRTQQGRAPNPPAIVVSSTCEFGADVFKKKFFTRTDYAKLMVTTPRAQRRDVERVVAAGVPVEVIPSDDQGDVDIPALMKFLAGRGSRTVLCEGGPTLNVALARRGAIDELFLTTALRLGGDPQAPRIFVEPVTGRPLELISEFRFEENGAVRELYFRFRFPGSR